MIKKINKKKKGSQVSMILSFILFVVSLLFVYYIASASISTGTTKSNDLNTIEGNLLGTLYSNVWVLRYYNSGAGCVSMSLPDSISGANSSAVGVSKSFPSEISGNDVLVNGTGFMKVYYSNLILNSNTFSGSGCTSVTPDSVKQEKIIPQEKIVQIMSNFSKNYTLLKGVLGVPSQMDYNLYFEYSNGTTIGSSKTTPQTDVYASQVSFDYLSNKDDFENGTMGIQIW